MEELMTIDDNDDLEQELEDTITRVKDVIAARQEQIEEYEQKIEELKLPRTPLD